MKRSGAIPLAAIVVLLAFGSAAQATDYSVSPIPVAVPIGTKTASMTVRNRDAEPLRLAVRVFDWKQSADSAMILTPDTTLVVYPRTLTVAPSTQQTVRIGLPATSGNQEVAYRVLFEELPNPAALAGIKGSGVLVRTNVGVPLFVEPAKATAAQKTLRCGTQTYKPRSQTGKRRRRAYRTDGRHRGGDRLVRKTDVLGDDGGLVHSARCDSRFRLYDPAKRMRFDDKHCGHRWNRAQRL